MAWHESYCITLGIKCGRKEQGITSVIGFWNKIANDMRKFRRRDMETWEKGARDGIWLPSKFFLFCSRL